MVCEQHDVDIATLAVVFALSQPNIRSTILGMKNIQQVQVAIQIARRFQNTDFDNETQETILEKVLTDSERKCYNILKDPTTGPFATVWKESGGVPKYQWDGIQEVYKFYDTTQPETKYDKWQQQAAGSGSGSK
jgi:hypothetical protein